jgi:hypothetical protein
MLTKIKLDFALVVYPHNYFRLNEISTTSCETAHTRVQLAIQIMIQSNNFLSTSSHIAAKLSITVWFWNPIINTVQIKMQTNSILYLVEICGFAVCGLIMKVCGFLICGLAHLRNFRDLQQRNEPKNFRPTFDLTIIPYVFKWTDQRILIWKRSRLFSVSRLLWSLLQILTWETPLLS